MKRTPLLPITSNTRSQIGTSLHLFVGPQPNGPKRCIRCLESFQPGEAWRRYTSPQDPEYGSYIYGVHEKCVNE